MARLGVFAVLFLAHSAFAAAPAWVVAEGRSPSHDPQAYFTGFAEAMVAKDGDTAACVQSAADNARRSLIQSIQVRVKAVTVTKMEDAGGQLSSYASAVTESASALDLKGLRHERYLDAGKGMCYALAVVAKADLAKEYDAKADAFRAEIVAQVAAAKRHEDKSDRTRALGAYLDAQKLLSQYRDARGLVEFAARGSSASFATLAAANGGEGLPSAADLKTAIDRLAQKPIQGFEDAAWLLAFYLKEQSDLQTAKVVIQPLTYRDTRMSSPFARYLRQLLEAKLVDTAKWSVVEAKMDAGKEASGAEFALVGSYWPQDGGLRLLVKLRRVTTGGIVAATEITVPAGPLAAAKIQIEPENYQKALAEQGLFAAGELQGGGLALELWTNKGAEGLVFTRGEKLKAFVRLNLPGYVRFLYHLADGKRALLLENYFIDAGKVNVAYELPQEFECDAPFGVERLQAFASTQPFEPLRTQNVDGYDIVVDDLNKTLRTTRGIKKSQGTVQKAEARLDLTTMER